MLSLKAILLVGMGGMIGSMLRYAITLITGQHLFPYATLIINIAGSFAIGLLFGWSFPYPVSNNARLFLATGICGGFTTFATFSLENVQLLQQQKYALAATYIVLSLVLSVAAAFAGFYLGKTRF